LRALCLLLCEPCLPQAGLREKQLKGFTQRTPRFSAKIAEIKYFLILHFNLTFPFSFPFFEVELFIHFHYGAFMKKIGLVFSLVLFLFIYSNNFAQIDTSDYFPIKTGNIWEYWGIENWTDIWIMMTIETIGDTLMSNGKLYQIFEEITYKDTVGPWDINYFYLRSEGKVIYYYLNYDSCLLKEFILYDFEKVDSSIWQICSGYSSNYRGIQSTSYYYGSIFNFQFEGKVFNWVEVYGADTSWAPMGSPYVDFVGKGIGIINRFIWDYCSFSLYGAKINNQIFGTLTSIDNNRNSFNEYHLSQNYPNPFNPSTKISWQSPVASWQTLKVYDILGNEVATLVNEYRNAGSYEIDFNPASSFKNLASSVYFYQLRVGDFVETKKMILLK
jgi:hypothetical protein